MFTGTRERTLAGDELTFEQAANRLVEWFEDPNELSEAYNQYILLVCVGFDYEEAFTTVVFGEI